MRGYQKRVIYLKNTGSRDFEEAYFVVRENVGDKGRSCPHMIEEANRIIDENFGDGRGWLYRYRWYIFTFLAGAALSALSIFLSDIFFGIF